MAVIETPYSIHQRFASYYLNKLRAFDLALNTKSDTSFGEAFALLDEDLAQIRQSLNWLNVCASEDSVLSHTILNFQKVDSRLLTLRLSSDEQLIWFKTGLNAARKLQDEEAVRDSLYRIGRVYYDTGRYDDGLVYLQELLVLAQKSVDKRGEAKAWLGLGIVDYRRGYAAEAHQKFEKGVALAKEIGDKSDLYGLLVMNLANTHSAQDQHDLAAPLFLESVALFRAEKDMFQLCPALNNLGDEYTILGQYAEALAAFEEGLQIARSIGQNRSLGYLLGNTAHVSLMLGQVDAAQTYLDESIVVFRAQGDLFGLLVFSAFQLHMSMTDQNLSEAYSQLCDMIGKASERKIDGLVLALLTVVARWYLLAGDPVRSLQMLDFVTAQPALDHFWLYFVEQVRSLVADTYPNLQPTAQLDQPLDQVVAEILSACK